jgi:hypothetical protein
MRVYSIAVFVLLGERMGHIHMQSQLHLCQRQNILYRIFMLVTSVSATLASLKHPVYVCLQEVGACVLLWHEHCM